MSIFTGKNGYSSGVEWHRRSLKALGGDAALYDYDTRLLPDDPILKWLKQQLAGTSLRILEIGAGFGRWAVGLQGLYSSYTGVDVVLERVAHAAWLRGGLPNATFLYVENEWNLGCRFDVVLSVTVLQHLLMPQAAMLLRSIERHLVPGGVALLAEWRIMDDTLAAAEAAYAAPTCPSHMIPKPLGMLMGFAPSLEWSGSNGQWLLRKTEDTRK
jgi:2-polyprenyl-3-methyl-5-hydroxy-6-metoxy-1,4-benzoquinol methylase